MKAVLWLAFVAAFCGCAFAQRPAIQTVLIVPFENQSKAPGLEWISDAFPEVLAERMSSAQTYVIPREDRLYAFERSGIPASAKPSRAAIYSVAEQMDADFVVLGSYDFDGSMFRAKAQLLEMKKLHLSPEVNSSGQLTSLIDVQTALAWELLEEFPVHPSIGRDQFLNASKPIRLDALENYVRGTLAPSRQQKIKYFREAIRLNPNYTLAMLQLGKEYYKARDYESASSWLSRIPKNEPESGEASFVVGMSEYYRGNYEKSFAAFSYLAGLLPLTEVYNNLGVVEERRGRRTAALEYFAKAVNADPGDPDYRFNLGVALFKSGDTVGAARNLREALQRNPNDTEARGLLDMITRGMASPAKASAPASSALIGAVPAAAQPRVPSERIKRNYDEASYRQLQMEIHNLAEQKPVAAH